MQHSSRSKRVLAVAFSAATFLATFSVGHATGVNRSGLLKLAEPATMSHRPMKPGEIPDGNPGKCATDPTICRNDIAAIPATVAKRG